jgi:hypothetical protein
MAELTPVIKPLSDEEFKNFPLLREFQPESQVIRSKEVNHGSTLVSPAQTPDVIEEDIPDEPFNIQSERPRGDEIDDDNSESSVAEGVNNLAEGAAFEEMVDQFRLDPDEEPLFLGDTDPQGRQEVPPEGQELPIEAAQDGAKEPFTTRAIRSFGEPIRGIAVGAQAAVQETLDLIQSGGDILQEKFNLPENFIQIISKEGKFDPKLLTEDEIKQVKDSGIDINKLPKILDDPKSLVGSLTKNISQFLFAMFGAGKLKVVKRLASGTFKERLKKGAIEASIADFVAGPEGTITEIIAKDTKLEEPIKNLLNNPEDSEAEKDIKGRLARTGEGGVAGVILSSFVEGLKILSKAQKAKAATGAFESVRAEIRPEDLKELGDLTPNAPLTLSVKDVKGTLKFQKASKEVAKLGLGKEKEIIERAARGGVIDNGKDKIFVNFARIDTADDVKNVVRDLVDKFQTPIKKAGGGTKKGFKAIEEEASKVDAFEVLINRREGQPLGAGESLALRRLWSSSATKVNDMAQNIARQTDASDTDMFQFRKMLAVHEAIQKEVISARTETARALAQWRIPAGSGIDMARQIEELLQMNGGNFVHRTMAEKIAVMAGKGMDAQIDEVIRRGATARTRDAVMQAWINGLLSGPKTHLVNMMSNTAVAGMSMLERATASRMAKVFDDNESVALGEATAQMFGMVQGMKDAFRFNWQGMKALGIAGKEIAEKRTLEAGAKVIRESELGTSIKGIITGESGFGLGQKIDIPRGRGFAEAFEIHQNTWLGKGVKAMSDVTGVSQESIKSSVRTVGQTADFIITQPGRFLGAEDEIFKTIGYRMELNSQAFRRASKQVLDGDIPRNKLKERIAEIIENPPDDIKLSSVDSALYNTFTNQPGAIGEWVLKGASRFPMMRVIMPFIKTPTNIFKFAHERTPWAPLMKSVRQDIAAGGARRDIALSRMALGTSLMMVATDMGMSGRITGAGPRAKGRRGERQTLTRSGWKPYSIRVGGKEDDMTTGRYFAFNRLDPMGTLLGLGGDFAELAMNVDVDEDTQQSLEKMFVAGVFSAANNSMSKTYLRGMSELMNAITNPHRREGYFERLVGSTVPTGMKEIRRSVDPYLRETSNWSEAIKNGSPTSSDTLIARRDMWGREIKFQSGLGKLYDVASPIYSSKADPEPIDRELLRIGAFIQMPGKTQSFEGISINMRGKPAWYNRMLELRGKEMKLPYGNDGAEVNMLTMLNQIVEGKHDSLSEIYKEMTDGTDGSKIAWLKNKIIKLYSRHAKIQLRQEFPELDKLIRKKRDQLNQAQGRPTD